jgi:hypothetical protein
MSSLASSASTTPGDVAFRARRDGKSAKFPTSLSAADGTSFASAVRSRSAYYSVIARAVARLPQNTRGARFALYDRAEIALTAELIRDPGISDEQVAVERLALERAILKVERDARKKEMPEQLQETHRSPFTSLLAFFVRPFSVRFSHRAT